MKLSDCELMHLQLRGCAAHIIIGASAPTQTERDALNDEFWAQHPNAPTSAVFWCPQGWEARSEPEPVQEPDPPVDPVQTSVVEPVVEPTP